MRQLAKQEKKRRVKALLEVKMEEEDVEREEEVAEVNTEEEAAIEVEDIMIEGGIEEVEVVKEEKELMVTSSTGTRDRELLDRLKMMKIVISRSLVKNKIISEVEEEVVTTTVLDVEVPIEVIEGEKEEVMVIPEVAEATEVEIEEVVVISHPTKTVKPQRRLYSQHQLLNESCINMFSCFY